MENNANTLSEKNVANNSNSIPVVPAQYRIYFFLLVSCFALWGMLNNMNDISDQKLILKLSQANQSNKLNPSKSTGLKSN